jgi:glycine cleavage system aminomethyltransferase T
MAGVNTAAARQTALFHKHEQAGANLVDHHGWRVPAYFTYAQKEAEQLSKSAGLSDVSWTVKLDLKGYGLKTPPELKASRAWRLGPQHYLATCDPSASEGVLAQLRSFSAPPDLSLPPPVYVTDVTSAYAQFLLAGPRSREVLRKLTSLNVSALANLACGQSSVAHVPSIILRDDLGQIPAFHVLVGREYGQSAWDAILHAGHEFDIAAVGLKALEFLGAGA